MKKTYNTPNMKVANMDIESLICESPVGLMNDGGSKSGEDATQGSALSRENTNLWDQEW